MIRKTYVSCFFRLGRLSLRAIHASSWHAAFVLITYLLLRLAKWWFKSSFLALFYHSQYIFVVYIKYMYYQNPAPITKLKTGTYSKPLSLVHVQVSPKKVIWWRAGWYCCGCPMLTPKLMWGCYGFALNVTQGCHSPKSLLQNRGKN